MPRQLALLQRNPRADVPARLTLPPVTDEGPHLGYAIQWFLFGTIAFAGAGIALKKG